MRFVAIALGILSGLIFPHLTHGAEVRLLVGTNTYSPFSTSSAKGTFVFMDVDPNAAIPIRPTQRSLGYREVAYKSLVADGLAFTPVRPSTNGDSVIFDYSRQAKATDLLGFWNVKNPGIVIGPDGFAYITDAHHTIAGYLQSSTHPEIVAGQKRTILAHIAGNFYSPATGPRPVNDSWWLDRLKENNALLTGPNGNQLLLPGDPGSSSLQPLRPSSSPMPLIPASIGAAPMLHDHYRSLTWGIVDGIALSAIDGAKTKIIGFKKYPAAGGPEINFVEFLWADFLRNRILWDDSKTGSSLGSPNGDRNAISAPLSFFTAVANGIALAKSEAYRDQLGRALADYAAPRFSPNTTNWAASSIANGLARSTDTYNLYLRDDSWINGEIAPSARSTNILHIDTDSALVLTQTVRNVHTLLLNAGGVLSTSWRDAVIPNSRLALPPGSGPLTLSGNALIKAQTILSNGLFTVDGALSTHELMVAGGILAGKGTINGSTSILEGGTLAPGQSEPLTINGALTLAGKTVMLIGRKGTSTTSASFRGLTSVTFGGTLIVKAQGEPLMTGDSFKVFEAPTYTGQFVGYDLPQLQIGLSWDTTRLAVDGTIRVR